MDKFFLRLIFCTFLFLDFFVLKSFGANNHKDISLNEELFFVGENVKILTIASRHPETPAEAPAVAEVITAEEWEKKGLRTLEEVLSHLAGFNVIPLKEGSRPVFRGIPEGVLFLYDGVPLTSDATKTLNPLDEELSLEGLSRIEIIKGPGSVLWGADAFAAIVNLVPKQGRESRKFRAGSLLGAPTKDQKVFLSQGHTSYSWESFLFFSGYQKEEFKENWAYRNQKGSIDDSSFYESLFTWKHLEKNFRIMGRFSREERKYVNEYQNISWPAEKEIDLGFLKLEKENKIGNIALGFKGYFQYLKRERKEAKLKTKQKNYIYYGEILAKKETKNKKGLITAGASFKRNEVKDSTINVRGFLPEYITQENIFSPIEEIADFNTKLYSMFIQTKYYLSDRNLFWAGIRLDDHNQYKSTISFNIGTNFVFGKSDYLKIVGGQAYRTPYSSQFLKRNMEPEKIQNISVHLHKEWRNQKWEITFFFNKIKNHINEDVYGGFSLPTEEKFWGVELASKIEISKTLYIKGNISIVDNWGDKEKYKILEYIIITPQGINKYFKEKEKSFETFNKKFANTEINWKITKNINLYLYFRYLGDINYWVLYEDKKYHLPDTIIGDISIRYAKKIRGHSLGATLAFKNFLDQKYYLPGEMGPEEGPRFRAFLTLDLAW